MESVLFYGEDTYGARAALGKLAAEQQAELAWLDAEDFRERRVAEVLGQGVSLFGRRLSVVRDPSQLPKPVQEQVALAVQRARGSSILWERGMPDRRSGLWRELKNTAREFPQLTPPALQSWLIESARERGGVLERAAAVLLVERAGLDRWRLQHELARLLLLDQPITAAVVEQAVALAPETEAWQLLEAVIRGEGRAAGQRLTALLAGGASELYVLSMLAYQWRTLLVLQAGLAEGKSEREIARGAKLHPYVVQKNVSQAERLPRAVVRGALARILATDGLIKSGAVEARAAVVMLVFGLARHVKLTRHNLP